MSFEIAKSAGDVLCELQHVVDGDGPEASGLQPMQTALANELLLRDKKFFEGAYTLGPGAVE